MSGNCSTDINPLEVGCVDEKSEPHKLLSRVFPSKIGGKPAWLALRGLPSCAQLLCDICQTRMMFLMQVYCPIESPREDSSTFHRSLFLFMCPNGACYAGGEKRKAAEPIKAFRSQLPRDNPFYPREPPSYDANRADVAAEVAVAVDRDAVSNASSLWQPVCALCGCLAEEPGVGMWRCPPCQQRGSQLLADAGRYCCQEHMSLDSERHASLCCDAPTASAREIGELLLKVWTGSGRPLPGCLLPEFGLLTGPDPIGDRDSGSSADSEDDEAGGDDGGADAAAGKENGKQPSSSSSCLSAEEADGGGNQATNDNGTATAAESGGGIGGARERPRQSSVGDSGDGESGGARRPDIDDFVQGLEEFAAKETPELRRLGEFKQAMRREPEQVFRYHRRARPLLISPEPVPRPPPCELCGAERVFECQVTPQILSWLDLDGDGRGASGPDFGTVLVFTCARSCRLGMDSAAAYAREFVYLQYV